MGFFSSVGSLFGGSKQSSQSGGFRQLPEEIQDAYTYVANDINNLLTTRNNTNGVDTGSYFRPIGQTADETAGFDAIRQGFTPTEDTLGQDISMLTNPFDSYVIDEINRQGQGEYSLLKQALNESGQMGSNRSVLGANDIDLTRMGQIGMFRQDQYNNALDAALNRLPALRSADAFGKLGIGEFQRNLDLQTKQAPIQALLAASGALQTLPSVEGGASSSGTNHGQGILGQLIQGAGSALAASGGGA